MRLCCNCSSFSPSKVLFASFFGLERGPSRLRHCRLYNFGAHFNKPQKCHMIQYFDPRQLPLKLDFSSVQWLVCCKPLGSIHCRAQPWLRPFRGILNQSQQKNCEIWKFQRVFWCFLSKCCQATYLRTKPSCRFARSYLSNSHSWNCMSCKVSSPDGHLALACVSILATSDVQKCPPNNVIIRICVKWY